MFRIGHGYDLHRMKDGEFLILGGEKIKCGKTFIAHSDGDVLVHAIMDALLGAAALGDIGEHFPDTSAEYKDIDSILLLKKVKLLLDNSNFFINNIDATILAQYPKLHNLKKKMANNIANALSLPISDVNIKASTQEGVGETGDGNAISAHAICILSKNEVKKYDKNL